jgi:hypothetical protein
VKIAWGKVVSGRFFPVTEQEKGKFILLIFKLTYILKSLIYR